MGDGMAVALIKGRALHRIDRVLNRRSERGRYLQALIEYRTSGRTVVDFFRKEGVSSELLDHLEADVFDRSGPGWWPEYPKKEEIVREGLIRALELAGDDRVVDSYWVCSGDLFQVAVTRSACEVDVAFLTPPPPHDEPRPVASVPEDIWVVMDEASAAEVKELNALPVIDDGEVRDPTPEEQDRIVEGPEGSGVSIVQPLRG